MLWHLVVKQRVEPQGIHDSGAYTSRHSVPRAIGLGKWGGLEIQAVLIAEPGVRGTGAEYEVDGVDWVGTVSKGLLMVMGKPARGLMGGN